MFSTLSRSSNIITTLKWANFVSQIQNQDRLELVKFAIYPVVPNASREQERGLLLSQECE